MLMCQLNMHSHNPKLKTHLLLEYLQKMPLVLPIAYTSYMCYLKSYTSPWPNTFEIINIALHNTHVQNNTYNGLFKISFFTIQGMRLQTNSRKCINLIQRFFSKKKKKTWYRDHYDRLIVHQIPTQSK